MKTMTETGSFDKWEIPVMMTGFILAGIAIVITGVSYLIYMEFKQEWLVWLIGGAFIVVGLVTVTWARELRTDNATPRGTPHILLILTIPVAFIISSQVCGLGLRACNSVCHITNFSLILLGLITTYRLYRGHKIGLLLLPMVVIGLIPHCVCHAPINTVWHGFMSGVAPTCEMMPVAASLFVVASMRGIRNRISISMVLVLLVVMVFIIAGGLFWGFPWQGCVDHPAQGILTTTFSDNSGFVSLIS